MLEIALRQARCGRDIIAVTFRRHPQLSAAVLVVVCGFLAILTGFPTRAGSTTLAGALFGAGASFIGAWVAEKNRATDEEASRQRRMEAARMHLAPELERILRHQLNVEGKLIMGLVHSPFFQSGAYGEKLEELRPQRPVLYPNASQFGDLTQADAKAVIDFYDAVQGVAHTVEAWIAATQARGGATKPIPAVEWSYLLRKVRDSLDAGQVALQALCPVQQPHTASLLETMHLKAAIARDTLAERIKAHGPLP